MLVALSGGCDSVALAYVLYKLGYVVEAAHCNFQLRGEESDRDELFVRDLCRQWGVPLHIKSFQTEEYASQRRISIEMAARELRYAWFEKLREEIAHSIMEKQEIVSRHTLEAYNIVDGYREKMKVNCKACK
jgi:tRNA(Ile)-lysidine synthase